jgi:5-methylcytosine-specific restriction enzyme A
MPTINLPKKRIYKRFKHTSKRANEIHKEVYNTTRWTELRLEYLRNNPLCEPCLERDIIKSAIDVHHKIPISTGTNMIERQTLGFDPNNLMSVCKDCHKKIHNEK